MDEQLVPAQESNLNKLSGRFGIKSLLVAFMCGVAVMGTISATAKATNAADAPLDALLQLSAQAQAQAPSSSASLFFQIISFPMMVVVAYLVNKWHKEIKEAGKTPTCGVKSFLCCFFGGCGGLLTICQPIDEA